MKVKKQPVCPGCSRHCTRDAVRCKRGRVYFEKLEQEAASVPPCAVKQKPRCKWEKLVEPQGTLWQLLNAGRQVKRALRSGRTTEAGLTARLTEAERQQLAESLARLNAILSESEKTPPKHDSEQ